MSRRSKASAGKARNSQPREKRNDRFFSMDEYSDEENEFLREVTRYRQEVKRGHPLALTDVLKVVKGMGYVRCTELDKIRDELANCQAVIGQREMERYG